MVLTENEQTRELYITCMDKCSELYNKYMTAIR